MTESPICPWCKLPMDDPADKTLDHIIPRSRGGPSRSWNYQYLHRHCNSSKGSRLTPEGAALAEKHGVILREPLPTAWPGSSVKLGSGKPNPYRLAREQGEPMPAYMPPPRPASHKVTVRKVYEVECRTCECVIGAEGSWEDGLALKREHVAQTQGHEDEAVA